MNKWIKVTTIALILAILCLPIKPVLAAEMNFSVQAIIPENQVDTSKTYFDLKMKSGQEQDLQVQLQNNTAKNMIIVMSANTAITNDNGIVEYNNKSKKKDDSLKYAFSDLAVAPKEVELPAKTTKTVKIHVKMPAKEYDGVILGGLYFTEKEDAGKKKKSEKSQVLNHYSYTIGVQLSETDKKVQPHLRLNKVEPGQVNYRNVLKANIQNNKATIIKDLKITGKVYKRKGTKPLYENTLDNLRMAPNSNFDFAVHLNNKKFEPGKYTFKGLATSGSSKWKFEKDFTIKGDQANDFNNQAVDVKKDYTWLYMLLGGLLILILIGIIFFLIYKLKKQRK
ncbi:DUF916 and DUF3324 domain-containing protein [Listeria sp. PSOL-1]|uniref:DUF916 and DUF3324 domain-containing protein n=1 Tax=Listeria sp. PSOL-1 TaxID=1844999 RepID=UPI0013D2BC1E|nr:DUF916 and DUF3324 domain-containing protein [Listeria sp. PSOL-1]